MQISKVNVIRDMEILRDRIIEEKTCKEIALKHRISSTRVNQICRIFSTGSTEKILHRYPNFRKEFNKLLNI